MAESNMQGKVYLVTGNMSGIGKVAAKELARMGATVVMVCRNRAKGEAVQAEIKEASGNTQVDLIVADLSSLSEVRRAANTFTQQYSQLHVLINNAGGVNPERKVTSDGLETTFAVNYLASFFLTQLLLETLKASAPARIVNLTSGVYGSGNIDFADLQETRKYGPLKAYAQAALAKIFFTYDLAGQLNGTDVTVNAVFPGLVSTHIYKGLSGWVRVLTVIALPFIGTSSEKGAQGPLYLATSAEVEGVSGKYFFQCTEKRVPNDLAIRRRLWQVTEELIQQSELKKIDPSHATP
jgi:NAD(P)-dependent dehydrogenase (short-subunit alcohol dehydrogenase family)